MNIYSYVILLLLSLSYFSLSAHIYTHWINSTKIRYWIVYVFILSFITVLGFSILGVHEVLGDLLSYALIVVFTGVLSGILIGILDKKILHYILRKNYLTKTNSKIGSQTKGITANKTKNLSASILDYELNVTSAVLVGILEELIFRGILVHLCLIIPFKQLIPFALAFNIIWFSLSHIEFGWPNVISKTPLGIITLLGTLITGSVLFAVIVHVVFNLRVLWEINKLRATLQHVKKVS